MLKFIAYDWVATKINERRTRMQYRLDLRGHNVESKYFNSLSKLFRCRKQHTDKRAYLLERITKGSYKVISEI